MYIYNGYKQFFGMCLNILDKGKPRETWGRKTTSLRP